MNKLLLFTGILCVAFSACIKNNGDNQNLNPVNQNPFDFMSVKNGSYWHYGVRDNVSYIRFARGKDSVMLGMTYSYYERKDDNALGFQPEYFGKNGDSYLTLIDIDGNENNYVNYLFWKDGATAGASWNNTAKVSSPIGNVNILIETSVAEDNLSMTINNNTYSHVIHVHSNAKGGPLATDLGTMDIWFTKGTGIIREEVDIDILGQYQQQHTDSLLEYYIAP